jgi:glucose/mannose-6-phosphate isomerase
MRMGSPRANNDTRLDDATLRERLDPTGMIDWIKGLPEQCKTAVEIIDSLALPAWQDIERVVVLGMGGSAIGGNLTRSLVETECRVPIAVNGDYTIPGYVDERTLVIASSYSGNTEETIAGYEAAQERRARIVVISSGGELAQRAQAAGQPWVAIPGGLLPRAALGYSLVTLLLLLERLGFIGGARDSVAEAVSVLERQWDRFGPEVRVADNPVKQLALKLEGRIPLIYGSGGWRGAVAYRWKCQVNENSKAVCFWNTFPELNHNETVGWEHPELTKEFYVVFLRDRNDQPKNQRRIDVTKELMAGRVAGMTDLWAEGESSLARLLSLVYPGDLASYYLALLYGVDPTPIQVIDRLKQELAAIDE